MIRSRGMKFRDPDDASDYFEQRKLDEERAAEFSLIDAGNEGRKAGMLGFGASLNPYTDPLSPEFLEWERQRMATIGARLAGKIAA